MSYSYLFVRLPTDTEIGPIISISELAMPLGPASEVQAELASIQPNIEWSESGDTFFGTVGPHCTAEFILNGITNSMALGYHGPSDWIPHICRGMGLHCWDPQINEIWCPNGKRIFVKRA